jgi:hypothetical protein
MPRRIRKKVAKRRPRRAGKGVFSLNPNIGLSGGKRKRKVGKGVVDTLKKLFGSAHKFVKDNKLISKYVVPLIAEKAGHANKSALASGIVGSLGYGRRPRNVKRGKGFFDDFAKGFLGTVKVLAPVAGSFMGPTGAAVGGLTSNLISSAGYGRKKGRGAMTGDIRQKLGKGYYDVSPASVNYGHIGVSPMASVHYGHLVRGGAGMASPFNYSYGHSMAGSGKRMKGGESAYFAPPTTSHSNPLRF